LNAALTHAELKKGQNKKGRTGSLRSWEAVKFCAPLKLDAAMTRSCVRTGLAIAPDPLGVCWLG